MISLRLGPSGTLQGPYEYPSRATTRVLAIQFHRIPRIMGTLRDLTFIKGGDSISLSSYVI